MARDPKKIRLVGLRRADGKYKGRHICEILDFKDRSHVTCTCGMIIECDDWAAESVSNNHEKNFNGTTEVPF